MLKQTKVKPSTITLMRIQNRVKHLRMNVFAKVAVKLYGVLTYSELRCCYLF